MKIIDAFCFFNELDMLELRLQTYWDYVDSFLIVEADHTFSGKKKDSSYYSNLERFFPYREKIIHHVAKLDTEGLDFSHKPTKFDKNADFWKMESRQRNAISAGLNMFGNSDIVIMSDVDEFPSIDTLRKIRRSKIYQLFLAKIPHSFNQEIFYYNAGNLLEKPWQGSIVTSCQQVRKLTPQGLRDKRKKLPRIQDGGYHFSYFMTPAQISEKISCFSHQEYNADQFTDEASISKRLAQRADLFDRDISFRSVTLDHFPEDYRKHLVKFPMFLGDST